MTRKQRRMMMIGGAGAVLFAAVGLILFALQDQIVFFNSPSDIVEKGVQPGQRFRLGGLVKEETLIRGQGTEVSFVVTDGGSDVKVAYNGILPDLFREGQGVVTEGSLSPDGVFVADTVLAKHDENYMPKEVAEAIKEQGQWKGSEQEAQVN
ncbi:cytochrome c maturation protein CcmE [uncultured Cohaesibacter sp.]|uniref:cytochrome c maturation protein CcmE n=1 Tax=uncultured Cohaesibacter sp. TaxID=1002546 RepID=UPI0029C867DC|nr:cytochrome c maturation protein CcmE [uncultured Cohaesibacter sp.]